MAKVVTPSRPLASAGGKVWIACKLPNGLQLRVFEMVTRTETTLNGTRDFRIAQQLGEPVRLNGNAVAMGDVLSHKVVGGYGLTQIDEDFWNAWLEANQNADVIKNLLVSGHRTKEEASDWAREHASTRSGLEELVRDKDPRIATLAAPGVGRITSRDAAA